MCSQQENLTAVAAKDLIPHRWPMRMIDSLTEWTGDSAVGVAVFDKAHMAVSDGLVTEPALVECVAQTVAAMEGRKRLDSESPDDIQAHQPGMLCGVSDFVIEKRPGANKRLKIEVVVRKRLGAMLLVDGRIVCDDVVVASGSLKLVG